MLTSKGFFIALEGPDGSGKSTQLTLLGNRLSGDGRKVATLHFPRYHIQPFGEMIARFLRGEFGDRELVDPHLVGLLFALDRKNASGEITTLLLNGNIVIADRYYLSNLAFQGAKIADREKRRTFTHWLKQLELDHFNIPKPDLIVFLDVPVSFCAGTNAERKNQTRDYLAGQKDIHENDEQFQDQVKTSYLDLLGEDETAVIIRCSEAEKIRPIDQVGDLVYRAVQTHLNNRPRPDEL